MSLAIAYSHRADLLNHLFHGYAGPPFAVRFPLWTWHSRFSAEPAFTLVFRSFEAAESLLLNSSETALGEAFVSGELDVEGDIFSAFEVAEWLINRPMSVANRILAELSRDSFALASTLRRGRKHSRRRDADSISRHYDLPVEFYAPWLGPTLLYSSAYFRDSNSGLDIAQTDKLDLICRKLDLHSGDNFMDIGCGWGSLAIHAASRYGAQTHGITISKSQAHVATRRVSDNHLNDLCLIEIRDYRDTLRLPLRFDKIASIGMFEHVGVKNLQSYFEVVLDLLKPGGAFLNSGIVRALDSPRRKQSFIDRFVFPDGELPTLSQALQAAEAAGFEVRDVESLREHYALTLRLWVRSLLDHAAELLETVSPRTFRTWLLYMAGSAAAFEHGSISVFQILLQRPDGKPSLQPHTREKWYTEPQRPNRLAAA